MNLVVMLDEGPAAMPASMEHMGWGRVLEPSLPQFVITVGRMLRATYSHGTGHIASGIQDQIRDAVLILVAPVPERDLRGMTRAAR